MTHTQSLTPSDTYIRVATHVIRERYLCPHSAVEWRTVWGAVSHDGKLDGKLESKRLTKQVNERQHEPWQEAVLTILLSHDQAASEVCPPHLLCHVLSMTVMNHLHDASHVLGVHYTPVANLQQR